MTTNFAAHAANETTFLTWSRTGISIIALGFVVEKFKLFLSELAAAGAHFGGGHPIVLPKGSLSPAGGVVLVFVGLAVILIAAVRLIRISRTLDDERGRTISEIRVETMLSAALAIAIAIVTTYVVLD
jgi:putative membrane protein